MSKAGIKVSFSDDGLKNLTKTLKKLSKLRTTVGIQGQDARERYENGVRVAQVAAYNEFGTKDIPARAFMRRSVKLAGDSMAKAAADGLSPVINQGKNPVDGMAPVGEALAEEIKKSLLTSAGWAVPNAPSTVAKKGAGKPPLYDSGKLRSSISWAVKQGRRVKKAGKP